MANILGTTQKSISNWEKGISEPTLTYVKKFIVHFKLNHEWLIYDKNENIFLTQLHDYITIEKLFNVRFDIFLKNFPEIKEQLSIILNEVHNPNSFDTFFITSYANKSGYSNLLLFAESLTTDEFSYFSLNGGGIKLYNILKQKITK